SSVHRGFLLKEINAERPLLVVQCGDVTDTPLLAPGQHDIDMTVYVHCVAQGDPLDAEPELLRLVADVKKAVTDDEDLRAVLNVVEYRLIGYTPNVDAMDRTGLGIT